MAQPSYTFVKGIYIDTRTGKPYLPKRIADVLDPMKQRVRGIKEVRALKRTDSQRAELLRLEKEIHKIELRAAQSMAATSVSRVAYYRSKHPTGPPGEMNIPSEEAYQSSLRKAGLKATEEYRKTGRSRSREDLPTLLRLIQNGLLTLDDVDSPQVCSAITRVLRLETSSSSKSYDPDGIETKVGKYWRDGLRIEPYNPEATDADGDGVIQEGTAWERPALTTMIDELGQAIIRGATSETRNPKHGVIDANGKHVKYDKPLNPATTAGRKAPSKPKKWSSPLGRSGWPSLKERGHRTLLDAFTAMHARAVAISTPSPQMSREWADLPTARVVSVTLPGGLKRSVVPVEGLRARIIRLEFLENARLLASDIYDSLRGRRISVHSDQSLERYRQSVDRVTNRFGPIITVADADRAIAEAFPNLVTPRLYFVDGDDPFDSRTISPDGLSPSANISPHQRGHIIGLLDSAMQRPDLAAKTLGVEFRDMSGTGVGGSAGLAPHTVRGDNLQFGYQLLFDLSGGYMPDQGISTLDTYKAMAEKFKDLLLSEESRPEGLSADLLAMFRAGNRFGVEYGATTLQILDMILDPNISDAETLEFMGSSTVIHEVGHLANYEARLLDNGIDLSEHQSRDFLRAAIAPFAKEILSKRPAGGDPLFLMDILIEQILNSVAAESVDAQDAGMELVDGHYLQIFVGHSESEQTHPSDGYGYGTLDNLTLTQKLIVERISRSHVSGYANVNERETIAELYSAFHHNPDAVMRFLETEEEKGAVMQLMDWLDGKRDSRHIPLESPRSQSEENLINAHIEELTRASAKVRDRYQDEVRHGRVLIFEKYIQQILDIADQHQSQISTTEMVLAQMKADMEELESHIAIHQTNIHEGASRHWINLDGSPMDNVDAHFTFALDLEADLRTTRRLRQQILLLDEHSYLPTIDYLKELVSLEHIAEDNLEQFKSLDGSSASRIETKASKMPEELDASSSPDGYQAEIAEMLRSAREDQRCSLPTIPQWNWRFE